MTQHIINVSGGKDSEAVYTLAARKYGTRLGAWRAIMCDTGNEHELTMEHVSTMHDRIGGPKVEIIRADLSGKFAKKRITIADRWPLDGVPADRIARALELMHPTGNPFLDMCMLHGRFPSTKTPFCTDELKKQVAQRQVVFPAAKNGRVLQWIGVRRDESKKRADTPLFIHDDGPGVIMWYPIRHWSASDVFAYLKAQGVDTNPLYKRGFKRVGCMPCINCGKTELTETARFAPEHIEKIREWEALVACVSKNGKPTFFSTSNDPIGGAGVIQAVDWARTSRGGRQHDLGAWLEDQQPSQSCKSVYGLCE